MTTQVEYTGGEADHWWQTTGGGPLAATPILYPQQIVENYFNSMQCPKNGTCEGWVGFGKCSHVKVGCSILHSKV